jgi:hypothetical protein
LQIIPALQEKSVGCTAGRSDRKKQKEQGEQGEQEKRREGHEMPDLTEEKEKEQEGQDQGNLDEKEVRELIINGRRETRSLKEWLERAQKAEGADEKMREAAEIRKGAEKAIEAQEALVEGLSKQNPQALRRALVMSGFGEREVDVWMNAGLEASRNKAAPSKSKSKSNSEDNESVLATLLAELEELKAAVGELNEARDTAQKAQEAKKYQQEIDSALDSDSEMTKIIQAVDVDTAKWLRRQAYSLVGQASNRLSWPRAVGEGIKTLKTRLSGPGGLLKARKAMADEGDEDTTSDLPPDLGVGPTSGGLASQLYRTGEGKRVGIFEDGFDEDVERRLAASLRKWKRKAAASGA